MHLISLDSIKIEKIELEEKLNKVENDELKLQSQLNILAQYHEFITANGFEKVRLIIR